MMSEYVGWSLDKSERKKNDSFELCDGRNGFTFRLSKGPTLQDWRKSNLSAHWKEGLSNKNIHTLTHHAGYRISIYL